MPSLGSPRPRLDTFRSIVLGRRRGGERAAHPTEGWVDYSAELTPQSGDEYGYGAGF